MEARLMAELGALIVGAIVVLLLVMAKSGGG